jgi:hypothetical protein
MEDIVGGRVRLRELTKTDAPFIFELLNTEGWLRYIGDRNISHYNASKSGIDRTCRKNWLCLYIQYSKG